MASPKYLHFNYKARYFKLGQINEHTTKDWFVLHGYAQLAEYFIKHFAPLQDDHTCIIAPEGLSRFYQKGFDGRIGATWMTREDRLTDIENYVSYLSEVYHSEIPDGLAERTHITMLGFSQGVATVSRWLQAPEIKYDRLVLWAGILPPDLDFPLAKERFHNKEVHCVYGDKDPFIDIKHIKEQEGIAAKLGIVANQITFDGVHEIDGGVLTEHFG